MVAISIVIPCLNERETIGRCVAAALDWIARRGVTGEVVVGDNGSRDGSVEEAIRAGARVIAIPRKGYGAALTGAISAAQGDLVIMGDADDSYDFSDLDAMYEALCAGGDLVMGNRFAGGIHPGAMPWKNRYIGNPVLSGLGRLLFGTRIRDFHCGLRGFTRVAFTRMVLSSTGFEFATEMVIKASLLRMHITEVPVTLRPAGRQRPPHLRPWRDGWRHLRFMLFYSPWLAFGRPGAVLMVLGAIICALTLPGPFKVGTTVFDIHSLFYGAMFITLGAQGLSFAVISRLILTRLGLLPDHGGIGRLASGRWFEMILVAGMVMLLLGASGISYSLLAWERHHFGELDPAVAFRIVIPSGLLTVLGLQAISTAFLVGMLTVTSKGADVATPATPGPADAGRDGGPT